MYFSVISINDLILLDDDVVIVSHRLHALYGLHRCVGRKAFDEIYRRQFQASNLESCASQIRMGYILYSCVIKPPVFLIMAFACSSMCSGVSLGYVTRIDFFGALAARAVARRAKRRTRRIDEIWNFIVGALCSELFRLVMNMCTWMTEVCEMKWKVQ